MPSYASLINFCWTVTEGLNLNQDSKLEAPRKHLRCLRLKNATADCVWRGSQSLWTFPNYNLSSLCWAVVFNLLTGTEKLGIGCLCKAGKQILRLMWIPFVILINLMTPSAAHRTMGKNNSWGYINPTPMRFLCGNKNFHTKTLWPHQKKHYYLCKYLNWLETTLKLYE